MQNKQHTIQFFPHRLKTNSVASPQAAIMERRTHGFHEFHGTPKKNNEPMEKSLNSWKITIPAPPGQPTFTN